MSTTTATPTQPTPAPLPEFPMWQRKPVSAIKIKTLIDVSVEAPTAALAIPDDSSFGAIELSIAFMQANKAPTQLSLPLPGYLIVDSDGNQSWMAADKFEAQYTKVN